MALPLLEHWPRIQQELNSAHALLLASDFDGTLVPIRLRPEECQLDVTTATRLERLSHVPGVRIAVVSGRDLADLQPRVGLSTISYAGNHGLEIVTPRTSFQHPQALACRHHLVALLSELRQQLASIPGVWVQDKGLSASIHYRQAAPEDLPQVEEIVTGRIVADNPGLLVLRSGKAVLEIRPKTDWNKGSALTWLLNQEFDRNAQPLLIYLGDDNTDEDAFRQFPEAITVHVGEREDTQARFFLAHVGSVHDFLRQVEESLTASLRAERLQ